MTTTKELEASLGEAGLSNLPRTADVALQAARLRDVANHMQHENSRWAKQVMEVAEALGATQDPRLTRNRVARQKQPIAWTWCCCCKERMPAPGKWMMGFQLCDSCFPKWKNIGTALEPFIQRCHTTPPIREGET